MPSTITRSELHRMAFCNSKSLPLVISDGGVAFHWVGIGWIEAGPANGHEVVVIEDPNPTDQE